MAAQFNVLRIDRRWRPLFWVVFFGLLLRFAYFAEHGRSAFFDVPLLDETFYDAAARALLGAGGADLAELNPSFRSLGYPAFLAACYALGGDSGRIVAVGAQHLFGVATALLAAALAFRLFKSPAAAAAAAAIYLLAGPPLYFEGELLAETLFTFEIALVALLLTFCRPGAGLAPWLSAGFAIGIAAQTRPNALLALGALLALAAWPRDPAPAAGSPAGGLRAAAAGSLAALAALLLCAAMQLPLVGRFELLPSQGGVNFYLGNKRGADGMIPRQAVATSYGDSYRDSVQVWSEEVFRQEKGGDPAAPVPPAELSRFWTAKTLREIAAAPVAWLGLLARKTVYLFSNAEIPNNKSYAFVLAEESRLLPWLPLRFCLLLALATAGLWVAAKVGDRPSLVAVLLLAALLAAGVIAFFVNARFRLPLWPLLAACGGGALLLPRLETKARRAAVAAALVFGLLSFLAPPTPAQLPGPGRDYFFRSLAHFEKGNYEKARADAAVAVKREPRDAAIRVQLGNSALAAGDQDAAYQAFVQAVALMPAEPRGFNNLGVVFERLGKFGDAYAAYLRATELSADFSPPWINAALLELRAGLYDRAAAHLDQVAERSADSVPYLCARAFLLDVRGEKLAARRLLAQALHRDPEAVEELARKNRQPLLFQDGLVKQ
jgi:tetratricopeptide (TPR) repeat protein